MIRPSQQERSHIELIAVYEICRVLGASLDLQRSFRAALNILDAEIGLPRVMIVLPDEDDAKLRVHSAVGLDREQSLRGIWKAGEGMIGRVYQSGVAVTVPDVTQADEFIDRTGAFSAQDGQMMSFMVLPIKTDQGVLGVVNTMGSVGQPPAVLGGMIGSALVGTFLGILLAYAVVEPLGGLLEQKNDEGSKELQCIKTTLLASMQGYAPAIAVEFGRKTLYSTERPSFSELEGHVKGKK